MAGSTNDFDTWPLGPVDLFVGRRISALRAILKIMPHQLAEAVGVTIDEMQAIEAGTRHLKPGEMMGAAQFLHVTPMFFFAGFDDQAVSGAEPDDTLLSNPLHA